MQNIWIQNPDLNYLGSVYAIARIVMAQINAES